MTTKELTDNEQYCDNLSFVYLFFEKSVPVCTQANIFKNASCVQIVMEQ